MDGISLVYLSNKIERILMNKLFINVLLCIILPVFFLSFINGSDKAIILENTNWRIISINNFVNGRETIWADFSSQQKFVLSFKEESIHKNEIEYGISLSSDTLNIYSRYYCHVNRGTISFNKADSNSYKISMPLYKGCDLSGTNLFIPLLSALNHQAGTYSLSNDTLILLGKSNTAGNIKIYLTKQH